MSDCFLCSLDKVSEGGMVGGEIDEESETEVETELIEVDDVQERQWDCESILRWVWPMDQRR